MIDIGIEAKTQDNSLFLNNTSVTAEGIVDYYLSAGGTQEGRSKSGYILQNPTWIDPRNFNPGSRSKIFLTCNADMEEYKNKRVHVEGTFVIVPEEKTDRINFTESYYAIIVDRIYVIE
jgi:hypothetical protein